MADATQERTLNTHFLFKKSLNLLLISSLLVMTGCTFIKKKALPPVPPEQRETTVQDGYFYQIAPGDTVNIFVWGLAELSGSVPVRPDGMLTTPLIEDLQASGKTPSQLARDLEKQFATYVRSPIVTVIVNGFVGLPTQQVRIIGEALKPAAVPFRKHMTILDLMIEVGGLTEFASGNKSVLVRYQNGKQQQYSVRLDDLIRHGDISQNVSLLPGDILIIPEAWF
jgi:polysaccharide export outer membrane protein